VRKAAGVASGRGNEEPLPAPGKAFFQTALYPEHLPVQRDSYVDKTKNKLLNSRAGRQGKQTKHIIHEEYSSPAAAEFVFDSDCNLDLERGMRECRESKANFHFKSDKVIPQTGDISLNWETIQYTPRTPRRGLFTKPSILEIKKTVFVPHSDENPSSVLTTTVERRTNPLSSPPGTLNPFRRQ